MTMFRSHATRAAVALVLCGAAVALPARAALDLQTVLRDVAAANPTLSARRAMVEAARRRVAPAGAWPAPMLELGVVNVPTSGRFDEDPMTMKMIGASQRIPLFGANRLARGAARAAASEQPAAAEWTGREAHGAAGGAHARAWAAGGGGDR